MELYKKDEELPSFIINENGFFIREKDNSYFNFEDMIVESDINGNIKKIRFDKKYKYEMSLVEDNS